MITKLNQPILGINGKPITVPASKENPEKTMTLRDVMIEALLTPERDDDEKKKWDKYEIYKKVRDAKEEVELKVDELALIKKLIGKNSPQLVMGQAWEMIESKEAKTKTK